MALLTWCVLPSRIIELMAKFENITSTAAMRPPFFLRNNCCASTPLQHVRASELRTPGCRSTGNALMRRSMVFAAELVCSVPNTSDARLCGLKRCVDGLEVSHFADENARRGSRAWRRAARARSLRRACPPLAATESTSCSRARTRADLRW
jgi:hypothetical protein